MSFIKSDQNYSRKREFLKGMIDSFPLLLGAFPFGLIYGTLAVSSGLSVIAALAMSAFVFAGSAQFIAVGLVAAGAPVLIIILTTFIVNLRHMLYSAALIPNLKKLSHWWKLVLAFFLTDETFAVAAGRYRSDDNSDKKHWYQLGSSVIMYLNWQLWCGAGLILGSRIPDAESWGLDVAMIVTFIGMTIPYIKNKPMVVTVLTAASVSLMTWQLPYKLGLIVAAAAGIFAGISTDKIVSIKKDRKRRSR